MTWLHLQNSFEWAAQIAVERVLNSMPEGILIALLAWVLLRMLGRQNASTRFAVWITALITVAGLPFLAGPESIFNSGHSALLGSGIASQISVPRFWVMPIALLWAIGICGTLAHLIAGLWQVRKVRSRCTIIDLEQIDPSLRNQMLEAVKLSGTSRPVIFAESEWVRVPAAIGFGNPMIVLPSWTLRELPLAELKTILIHELAHVRRRDDWTNLLQKIVRAIFFFHPAVWWIDRRLSLEREIACDDAVLAETGNPRAYAGCLVALLEKNCARRGWTMAQAAVRRAHEASLRIAQILDPRRSTSTGVRGFAIGLAGTFSVACVGALLCAPRLVAFSPNPKAIRTPAFESAGVGSMIVRDVPTATVVPAAFHPYVSTERIASGPNTTALKQRIDVQHVATKRDASALSPERKRAVGVPAIVRSKTNPAPMLVLVETRQVENPPTGMNGTDVTASQTVQKKGSATNQSEGNWLVQTTEYIDATNSGMKIQVWQVVLITASPAGSQYQVIGKSI